MAITQLGAPCWYVRHKGGEDHQNDLHYKDQAEAEKDAARIRRDHAEEDPKNPVPVEVGQLSDRCWEVHCDGDCGEQLRDAEEDWFLHAKDPAQAEEWMNAWDWVFADGMVLCADDKPDDCEPGAPWHVPGQLTLGEDVA